MSVINTNNPLSKVVFAQIVIQFSAENVNRLVQLSTVTSGWNDAICNFSGTCSPVAKNQAVLHVPVQLMSCMGSNADAKCIALIKNLTTEGADPNRENKEGCTPLYVAVMHRK